MKKFILYAFLSFTINLFSQDRLYSTLKDRQDEYTPAIMNRIKKFYGKKIAEEYANLLFIQSVKIKNINISEVNSADREDTVLCALKKKDIIDHLIYSKDPHFKVIIYNDSLDVLGLDCGYICQSTPDDSELLKYYWNQNVDLIFFIKESGFDYFVLIDHKIYKLLYDKETNSFSKVSL